MIGDEPSDMLRELLGGLAQIAYELCCFIGYDGMVSRNGGMVEVLVKEAALSSPH